MTLKMVIACINALCSILCSSVLARGACVCVCVWFVWFLLFWSHLGRPTHYIMQCTHSFSGIILNVRTEPMTMTLPLLFVFCMQSPSTWPRFTYFIFVKWKQKQNNNMNELCDAHDNNNGNCITHKQWPGMMKTKKKKLTDVYSSFRSVHKSREIS